MEEVQEHILFSIKVNQLTMVNYINRFQNAHALSVSVGNRYSDAHLMHTFLDNFNQGDFRLLVSLV